jgi:DNA-binding MarR family transcriptional regulator/GNAT superfamily N-acetyltransferase
MPRRTGKQAGHQSVRQPDPGAPKGGLDQVAAVRRFNRFYTREIGVLQERLLHSPFSLAQGRVIYELANNPPLTATEVGQHLKLDGGYVSRLIRTLNARGVVAKRVSETDRRQQLLALTAKGRRAFAQLDSTSTVEIRALLDRVTPDRRPRLIAAMHAIETLLGADSQPPVPYILRPHQPGDMGWIVHRQAVIYAQEYGWNDEYEAVITRIASDFLTHFDPKRERCWIAEREGEIVGSVFAVKDPDRDGVAKLRLLYVEPSTRGLGIGTRLVQEVTRFARQAGYHTLTLWTNSVLVSARRIYEAEGYHLVSEEPHHSFGHDLVAQVWEKGLRGPVIGSREQPPRLVSVR